MASNVQIYLQQLAFVKVNIGMMTESDEAPGLTASTYVYGFESRRRPKTCRNAIQTYRMRIDGTGAGCVSAPKSSCEKLSERQPLYNSDQTRD
jgi:hypothetical protein